MATTTPTGTTTSDPFETSVPLQDQAPSQPSTMQRTRSKEMVDDAHHNVIDEDPLMISQSLTYVTDDGSVMHSFQSAPFTVGEFLGSPHLDL